jgi:hypothetical protein
MQNYFYWRCLDFFHLPLDTSIKEQCGDDLFCNLNFMSDSKNIMLSLEQVSAKILRIRGEKVMLDRDLAELYGVETKRLKESVRRNIGRFPADFMFELSKDEAENLRTQFSTSNWGGTRYVPMVFTEQGVAMLSSVLRSKRAVEINILIMRAFVRMKELLYSDKTLALKIEIIENKLAKQGKSLQQVIHTVNQLLEQPEPKLRKIGFRSNDD